MEIENDNPYPGVRYHGESKRKPWLAQICRSSIRWSKTFSTHEAARDAIVAKLKKFGLKPIGVKGQEMDALSREKTNEMDRLIDFEDRVTDVAA